MRNLMTTFITRHSNGASDEAETNDRLILSRLGVLPVTFMTVLNKYIN